MFLRFIWHNFYFPECTFIESLSEKLFCLRLEDGINVFKFSDSLASEKIDCP